VGRARVGTRQDSVVKGLVFTRGTTRWEVISVGDDGRVFCRSANRSTAWMHATMEPPGQVTPEDSVVCICGEYGDGYANDPESGLYVHSICGKPTQAHLSCMAARAGAWT
jgi:hypothetical protein